MSHARVFLTCSQKQRDGAVKPDYASFHVTDLVCLVRDNGSYLYEPANRDRVREQLHRVADQVSNCSHLVRPWAWHWSFAVSRGKQESFQLHNLTDDAWYQLLETARHIQSIGEAVNLYGVGFDFEQYPWTKSSDGGQMHIGAWSDNERTYLRGRDFAAALGDILVKAWYCFPYELSKFKSLREFGRGLGYDRRTLYLADTWDYNTTKRILATAEAKLAFGKNCSTIHAVWPGAWGKPRQSVQQLAREIKSRLHWNGDAVWIYDQYGVSDTTEGQAYLRSAIEAAQDPTHAIWRKR